MRPALALFVVVLAHYGYHFLPLDAASSRPESWSFYVLRGVEGSALCLLLLPSFATSVIGTFACWLGFFEETQTAVCGATAPHNIAIPAWSHLCTEQAGHFPYIVIASVSVATLLTKPWEKKNGRRNT